MKNFKARVGYFSATLLLLTSPLAFGYAGNSEKEYDSDSAPLNWQVEGGFQVHSLVSNGNIMFGPGLMYELGSQDSIGFRTLLTVGTPGTYMASLVYRHAFSQSRARVFAEPSASYNLVNYSRQAFSVGAALGFQYDLTRDLGFVGTAGFEGYNSQGVFAAAIRINSFLISPKTMAAVVFAF